MPLDFRYHLASLTAVFAALLIGILLGVAMKEGPRLSEQMSSLRDAFKRAEALNTVDRNADEFNKRTRMLLIRNRLRGRNVAIVYNAGTFKKKYVGPVQDILEESGAQVTAVIALQPQLRELSNEQATRIYKRLGRQPEADSLPDLLTRLGLNLGCGWETAIAPAMEREKLIRIDGDFSRPISTVVFLGGAATTQQVAAHSIDIPFLRSLQHRGLRVAAAEIFAGDNLDTFYSAIPIYKSAAPLTIDNIDKQAGRITLVLTLADNRQGHYGYKETADDVAPQFEE